MLVFVLALTLGAWVVCGYALTRYALRQHEALVLLPMSLGLGFVAHNLLLNLTQRLLTPPLGYALSLGLMFGLAGLLVLDGRHFQAPLPPLRLGLTRREALGASLFVLVAWAGLANALLRYGPFDLNWHIPLAGVLGAEGLPARFPFNTQACLFYHYGLNLMAGSMVRATGGGLVASEAIDLSLLWLTLAWVGLAFAFGWRLGGRSVWAGAAATIFLLCGSGANGFLLLWREGLMPSEGLWRYLGQVAAYVSWSRTPVTDLPTLPHTSFMPLNLYLRSVSINGAVVIFLSLGLLLTEEQAALARPRSWRVWLVAGLALGMMELYAESFWAACGLSLAVYTLRALRPQARRGCVLRHALLLGGLGLGLPLIQGGVMHEVLFCHDLDTIPGESAPVNTVRLARMPGYYTFLDGSFRVDLSQAESWPLALVEWNVWLLLWPFLLWHYGRVRPSAWGLALAVGIGGALALFSIIEFNVKADAWRVFAQPLMMLALLTGVWLAHLWQARPRWRSLWALLAVLLLHHGLLWYEAQALDGGLGTRFASPLEEEVARQWYARLPAGSLVIDPTRDLRPPGLLGTYTLSRLSRSNWTPRPDINTYLRRYPDPAYLRFLGADYLLMDRPMWEGLSAEGRALFEDESAFRLVFDYQTSTAQLSLYALNPSTTEAEFPPFFADLAGSEGLSSAALVRVEWPSLRPMPARVFMPRDNYNLVALLTAQNLLYREQVEAEDGAAISAWAEEKRAAPLQAAGYTHLLVDDLWLGTLQPFEADNLNDRAQYEVVKNWQGQGEAGYILYRLVK